MACSVAWRAYRLRGVRPCLFAFSRGATVIASLEAGRLTRSHSRRVPPRLGFRAGTAREPRACAHSKPLWRGGSCRATRYAGNGRPLDDARGRCGGGISLVVRFRRARGVERQQLKWFAFSGVVFCAVFAIGPVLWYLPESPGTEWIWTVLFLLGASTIPVAVGIAILHYRLYEIDLLSISIPDRELCLAGRCVPLPGDGSALACHVLGHLVLVGLRDQVNRYEGYGGHREYVEGY